MDTNLCKGGGGLPNTAPPFSILKLQKIPPARGRAFLWGLKNPRKSNPRNTAAGKISPTSRLHMGMKTFQEYCDIREGGEPDDYDGQSEDGIGSGMGQMYDMMARRDRAREPYNPNGSGAYNPNSSPNVMGFDTQGIERAVSEAMQSLMRCMGELRVAAQGNQKAAALKQGISGAWGSLRQVQQMLQNDDGPAGVDNSPTGQLGR